MRFFVAIAAAVVVGFGGFELVGADIPRPLPADEVTLTLEHRASKSVVHFPSDAANPSDFTAVVNPLSSVPADGELYDASCPSASSCVAVGLSGGRIPFVLVGDPSNWGLAQAHAIELDTGAYAGSVMGSISCVSLSWCVGVGSDANLKPLALVGDPSTWNASNAREIPLGSSVNGGLDSVKCVSSSWCVAVGWDGDDFDTYEHPVVLAGDPKTWSAAQLHVIHRDGALSGVTCTSASSCVAVGDGFVRGKGQEPLVLAGDPATWSSADVRVIAVAPVYPPAWPEGGFRSVTCASASSCVAVGDYDDSGQPLVLAGDPLTWGSGQARELVLGPTFGSGGSLNSVTCTSSSVCIAVGSDWNDKPLMVAGDPSTWDAGQVRHLDLGAATDHDRGLGSITCSSSSACVATGWDVEGNSRYAPTEPLVLAGDPSTWGAAQAREIMLTGVAFGAQARLSTFACAAATSCLDLGRDQGTYLVRGDPATWDTDGVTQLPGTSADRYSSDRFYDSACAASTFCVAVGKVAGDPFVLAGDPATWGSAQGLTIHLSGRDYQYAWLSSVSCVSTTWCVAVGNVYAYGRHFQFVIAGDPTTWTGADVRKFRFETRAEPFGTLASVACSSTTYCVAVGDVGDLPASGHPRPSTYRPIVLVGNPASWGAASARRIVLSQKLGEAGRLLSVACTSSTYCVGVGEAVKGTKPLVLAGNPAKWGPTSAFTLSYHAATPASVGGLFRFVTRDLRSISCATAGYCVAVGGDKHGAPWYITGDPATWRGGELVRPESDGASFVQGAFVGASCVPTECFAGGFANGGDFVASFSGG